MHTAIREWNEQAFANEALRADATAVVDFWAGWCAPCRALAPVFESLAAEYGTQARFGKVNVDEERELARQFHVRAIPCLLVLRGGRPKQARGAGLHQPGYVAREPAFLPRGRPLEGCETGKRLPRTCGVGGYRFHRTESYVTLLAMPRRAESSAVAAGELAAVQAETLGLHAEMDALMERYVDGDLVAFDRLYALCAPRVHRLLLQMVRNRSDADDLLQVTFVKLHAARPSWVRGGRVLPYLLAIARNAARDSRRSFASRKLLLTRSGEMPEVSVDPPKPEDPALAEALAEAMQDLPPQYQEAIHLTKHQELSLREAALVAGTTETGMKLRVHRAYKQLRKLLGKTFADTGGVP